MDIKKIKLSYTTTVNINDMASLQRAENGWSTKDFDIEKDFRDLITTYPYSIINFKPESAREKVYDKKKGREVLKNQRRLEYADSIIANCVIYDIDNQDAEEDVIELEEMHKILNEQNLAYATITTKSHGIKGNHDRYRLFLFLDWGENAKIEDNLIPIHKDYFMKDNARKSDAEEIALFRRQSVRFLHETIAEKIGILKSVDPATISNFAGKFVPSPKNAIFHTNFSGEAFKTSLVKSDVSKKFEELKTTKKQQKRAFARANEARKNVGTWEWFEENKDYPVLVNPKVIYGLDLRDVISYYEKEEPENTVREYESGGYSYVDVKSLHKYSIMVSPTTGDFVYYDFNASESGDIVRYMKDKFPAVRNILDAAIRLKRDFSDEIDKMKEKIILTNPAFYVAKLNESLDNESNKTIEEVNTSFAKEAKFHSYRIVPKSNKMFIVTKSGEKEYTKGLTIPKEEINKLIKKASLKKRVGEDSQTKPNSTPPSP